MKKVSVIVNCYNGEKYLTQCISSILNQKYRNFELIFFDNNSSDKSREIVENFKDERIKYILSKRKLDLYHARNEAINFSNGELIAFLDCDDWWEKNYLSSREKYFDDTRIDFFYSNTNIFYERKKKNKLYRKFTLPNGNIFSSLSKDYFIIISGTIFKRDLFTKYGYFNQNYNIIGDYDFIMKISKYCNAHATNLPLLNCRIHENNFLKNHSQLYYQEYKDWYEREKKTNDNFFKKYENFFKNKLEYIENIFLIENKKKIIFLLYLILNH